jgi:hypothetical protein
VKDSYKVIDIRKRLDVRLNNMHNIEHAKVIHCLTESRRARLAMVSEGARWRMASVLEKDIKEVMQLQY